ncbi:MAG: single-stranded DNA-binding protein [Acidobacteria bacterium]|nr:single-stranded DNA-binding protein [Acidobacteriota bacterium]
MSAQSASQCDDRIEKLITVLGQGIRAQNEIMRAIAISLQAIESHLRQMAISANPAPNYQRALSEYPGFDWSSIGATVVKEDSDGASVVEWNGTMFTRRSANNKFPEAIWFSCPAGKDADGNTRYRRLITFKRPSEAEPIAEKAKRAISSTI